MYLYLGKVMVDYRRWLVLERAIYYKVRINYKELVRVLENWMEITTRIKHFYTKISRFLNLTTDRYINKYLL